MVIGVSAMHQASAIRFCWRVGLGRSRALLPPVSQFLKSLPLAAASALNFL